MPFPIVLAHGIARFDALRQSLRKELEKLHISPPGDALHYFRNIKPFLEANGFIVYYSDVSFAASVKQRSEELALRVTEIVDREHNKVHIIAHSMGGLDARHMIVDVANMAEKVACLTTVGTPHLGTSFADWGIRHGGDRIIRDLKPLLDLEGFEDLQTEPCRAFNARAMDAESANSVIYQTYAARQGRRSCVLLPLQGPWDLIRKAEGENDGLVPVTSQQWCAVLTASNGRTKSVSQKQFPVDADHLNEVGWWHPDQLLCHPRREKYEDEIKSVYLEIARSV